MFLLHHQQLLSTPQLETTTQGILLSGLGGGRGGGIPGIDAMLYLLSLYSLPGARGGPLKKKTTQHTLGQRVRNASLCGATVRFG